MDQQFPFVSRFLKLDSESTDTPTIAPETSAKEKTPNHDFLGTYFSTPAPLTTPAAPVAVSAASSTFSAEELTSISTMLIEQFKQAISPQKFSTFFENRFAVSKIDEQSIHFSAANPFVKMMVEQHYIQALSQLIETMMGRSMSVHVHTMNEAPTASPQTPTAPESGYHIQRANTVKATRFTIGTTSTELQPTAQDLGHMVETKVIEHAHSQSRGKVINTAKTFDTFIVGPSNNMAYMAAQAASENPGQTYPSLYIYSGSGLGKTHLLHAIGNKVRELFPHQRVCLTSSSALMDDVVHATRNNAWDELKRRYRDDIDVLMIDDIHDLRNKDRMQEFFFNLFNELHEQKKQIVFTSDKAPKEITGIEERLLTRLSWGLVIDIQQPDLETRIAILKQKALEHDVYLPDDVVNLIAGAVKNNIRELEGSLVRLGMYSSMMKVDIDLEIAKEQLKLNDSFNPDKISMDSIAKAVSAHYKIGLADMKSESRKKEVTLARQVAMYLSYQLKRETFAAIGKFFGGRDHTTTLHAVNKITKALQNGDNDLSQSINEIERNL